MLVPEMNIKDINCHVGKTVMLDFQNRGFKKAKCYFIVRAIGKLRRIGNEFSVQMSSFDAQAVKRIEMIGVVPNIKIKTF